MFGWVESSLLVAATVLLIGGFWPPLRIYRPLLWGTSILFLITALFPRRGNTLAQYLFAETAGSSRLPVELFGVAWWVLGAWLVKSLLDLILRRTIFPHDHQPHARRLFADLASGLIYVVAFVGIMDTVLKQPISGVLATSGVLAIVLGLALQNTLADVFSGLAINIERPFGAGDWITVTDHDVGQVIEINWRATRLRTQANDLIVIPNSVAAKSVVTNHSRANGPRICTIRVAVDQAVPTRRVLDALRAAGGAGEGVAAGTIAAAYASDIAASSVVYDLTYSVDDFAMMAVVRSDVIARVTAAFQGSGIPLGGPAMDIHIVAGGDATSRNGALPSPAVPMGNSIA
jgi:small-conductance mechanosensitive channel